MEFVCKNCGKHFKNKKQRKYCCRECYLEYISKNNIVFPSKRRKEGINGVKVKCAICGKEEIVSIKRSEHYKCCSQKCLGIYYSKTRSKRIKIKCEVCGKEFEIKRSQLNRTKYCSKKCLNESLKNKYLGENNPNSIFYKLGNYIPVDSN